ncbi:MAG: ATP-binding cassette domain-containing protein [Bacteroidales bacterium]|nr:ATP-binding cassette domain-containing protein [Bacteroidales bacterium]
MIKVSHISKYFQGRKILDDIDTEFLPGKCNLTIGKSGSGKTVLLRTIAGLYQPEEGFVSYDDRIFANMSREQKVNLRKDIGFIFQEGALFDSMNVEENIMFPLRMFTKMRRKERLDRVNYCLDRVNLKDINKMYPSQLSGGMRKRVAIARAISAQPKYLFCDEPNSGLDPVTSILIDKLIMDITHEFNMTTIVNTHDMNSVMEIGESIIFINQGKLWWKGNSGNVLSSDNKELNDFIFCSALTKKIKEKNN